MRAVQGGSDPIRWPAAGTVGVALMVLGLVATLIAQQQLGTSWRIGVDPQDRSALVTAGLFARVRNPIFSAMVLFAVGTALAVPGVTTGVSAALVAGVLLQVRLVEEPHLRRVHGAEYQRYLRSYGRFLPPLPRRTEPVRVRLG